MPTRCWRRGNFTLPASSLPSPRPFVLLARGACGRVPREEALPLRSRAAARASVPSRYALSSIMKTTRVTRIRTERRIGSSSPIGQDLMNVVERHAEQLFEFLARRESTPPGMREAGARVSEARQSDGAAVVGADAGLARSADGAAGLIRASTSSCFRV